MDSKELRSAYGDSIEVGSARYAHMSVDEILDEGCRTPGQMVKEFHHAFNVPVPEVITDLDEARKKLRMDLLDEEYEEFKEAVEEKDVVEVVSELADLVYVAYGMALELGVDLDAVITEIHRANMSKLGPDGRPVLRPDGKVLKGDGFRKADVASVLGVD